MSSDLPCSGPCHPLHFRLVFFSTGALFFLGSPDGSMFYSQVQTEEAMPYLVNQACTQWALFVSRTCHRRSSG